MAAGNKPTAVHFTLIGFVMVSLIAGVMAYMNYADMKETEKKLTEATTAASNAQNLMKQKDDEVQALKGKIGHAFDDVLGRNGATDQTAVVPKAEEEIRTLSGALSAGTYSEALGKLRTELNSVSQERNTLQAEVNDLKARMLALDGQKQVTVDTFQKQAADAEAGKRTEISAKEEAVANKDKEIATIRTNLSSVQQEFDQFKDSSSKRIQQLEGENKRLVAINDKIREELQNVTKVSFEHPDGQLEWVDYQNKLVWINLGNADNLPIGTTFSVYNKANHGVGRGAEDIKGSIEITRVMDDHRAEARIVKDDPAQPFAKGDPIYTPLWSPGRKEAIAIVGMIDLDGDGQSDRAFFHEKVAGAGAVIDLEVDDQGNRLGDGFTINTKYLVKARIPDPTLASPNEKEAAEKIVKQNFEIEKEARLRGIRTISLNDFLSHIGYKPERRNWRPGEESPYNLKHGSHSTGVNESAGNRTSAGTVSGAFKNTKRVGPASSSSGQTSRLFK